MMNHIDKLCYINMKICVSHISIIENTPVYYLSDFCMILLIT